jgi:hypothetical protein
VCLRPSKVDQQAIAEQLRDMAAKALDYLGRRPLISPHDVAQILRVELFGKRGGVRQVTEHDCELATFGIGWMGCDWH